MVGGTIGPRGFHVGYYQACHVLRPIEGENVLVYGLSLIDIKLCVSTEYEMLMSPNLGVLDSN